MHPAGPRVEALVDEELPPCDCTIRLQALFAHHLQLRPEKERGVRIDQQQRVVAGGVARRNRHAVGAGRFFLRDRFRKRLRRLTQRLRRLTQRLRRLTQRLRRLTQSQRRLAVKRLQLVQIHAFNITPDTALRKAQRHPWFKTPQHPRLHLRMFRQVVIQAVRKCIHERF